MAKASLSVLNPPSTKTPLAPISSTLPVDPLDPYRQALHAIRQIEDAVFRRAATDALIDAHVLRTQGYRDPGGNLAMSLRRAAMSAAQ